jgi:hypothetical protein
VTNQNPWQRGEVSVLLGKGDGTFQSPVSYSSGGYWTFLAAIADVNGDGFPDMIVTNNCASVNANGTCNSTTELSVLLGNGDGTFQAPTGYYLGGYGPPAFAVGDLNADGKLDIAVGNVCVTAGCPSQAVGVLLGNGDGTFQLPTSYQSGGYIALSAAVADVNSDGKPDLIVTDECRGFSCNGSGAVVVLLNKFTANTTTKVTSSLSPSLVDQSVTFTAMISSTLPIPDGGTVTFYDGDAQLGSGSTTNGVASLTTSFSNAGRHTIKASYSGDLFHKASSGWVTQMVLNLHPTSTTLTSSLNPSTYGQKVTWTATVTPSGSIMPTGTVKFTWSIYTIGSATLNSSGVATFSRSNLNADSYPLTAVYVGDAANLGSTSAVVNQVVLETTSTAALTSSPNPSTQGQAVTFTAKISSPTVTPTGPVTFTAGKTLLGTAQLSGGKATLTTSSLPAGSTKVTVTYNGDSNIAKSSASVTQTVR